MMCWPLTLRRHVTPMSAGGHGKKVGGEGGGVGGRWGWEGGGLGGRWAGRKYLGGYLTVVV